MTSKQDLRKDALQQGKSVLHAVCIIKHNHLIKEVTLLQQCLAVMPFTGADDKEKDLKATEMRIEAFKNGIELSDGAIPKKLKGALITYADACLDYHRAE